MSNPVPGRCRLSNVQGSLLSVSLPVIKTCRGSDETAFLLLLTAYVCMLLYLGSLVVVITFSFNYLCLRFRLRGI